jgi:V8-like Glu-specific endopeptidase
LNRVEIDFKKLYIEYSSAIAFIAVIDDKTGNEGIGTAFHVGDGIFVTARHVVEGKEIKEIATTKRIIENYQEGKFEELSETIRNPYYFKIIDGPHFPKDKELDIALLKVDLLGIDLPVLNLNEMTSYHINDNTYILDEVLIIGYPPIPFTIAPIQITSKARVNAVSDVHHSQYPHLIVSTIARGGFSGGPVLEKSGQVIGIVTESLIMNGESTGSGFMSILCIEPVIKELINFYNFDLEAHNINWNAWWEPLYAAKLSNKISSNSQLNPRISDAEIYLYDDDRDVFAEIKCDNAQILETALMSFRKICEIDIYDEDSTSTFKRFIPDGALSEYTLQKAALSAVQIFLEANYKLIGQVQRQVEEIEYKKRSIEITEK